MLSSEIVRRAQKRQRSADPEELPKRMAERESTTEERRHDDEALSVSEEIFRVLTETSPAAIFLYQGENILYANNMAETITGYTKCELLSMKFPDIVHPCQREDVRKRMFNRLKGDDVSTVYELRCVTKNGTEKWLHVSVNMIRYKGQPAGLISAIDITGHKKAEEALLRSKAQAELYVDLMGHDINNMNQVAMGYLELADDLLKLGGTINPENAILISKPLEMLNSCTGLIVNVRKLQRARSGGYEPEIIDVGTMLDAVRSRYSHVAGRDMTINYSRVDGCFVNANELLEDVFLNLVGNAVKHSSGPLTVNIMLEKVNEEGREYCRIAVEDDGPGISDALKSRMFNRLSPYRTNASVKGFGLCLIKMLVEDFNGKFWLEDRVPGDYTKGCRFVVMLQAMRP